MFLGVTTTPASRWLTPSGLQPLARSLWPPWDLPVVHQLNPYSHRFTRELAPAGIKKQHTGQGGELPQEPRLVCDTRLPRH